MVNKWFENKDKKYKTRYREVDNDNELGCSDKKGLLRKIIDYIMD